MENEKCESPSILRIMTQGLGKSKVLIPVFLGTRSVRKNFNERVSWSAVFENNRFFGHVYGWCVNCGSGGWSVRLSLLMILHSCMAGVIASIVFASENHAESWYQRGWAAKSRKSRKHHPKNTSLRIPCDLFVDSRLLLHVVCSIQCIAKKMHIDDADAGGSLKPYKIDCLTMARWGATIIKEHQFFWQYHVAMVICVVSCRGCVHWRDLLHEHTMVSAVLFAKMTRIDRTNAGGSQKHEKSDFVTISRGYGHVCGVVYCWSGLTDPPPW